jgi:hypothetical protein
LQIVVSLLLSLLCAPVPHTEFNTGLKWQAASLVFRSSVGGLVLFVVRLVSFEKLTL